MIVLLLLVIIAILLFGSSAVIGAIGAILGFIVAVVALFFGLYWFSGAFGIDAADMLMYGSLALLPIAVVAGLLSKVKKAPALEGEVKLPQQFHSQAPSREERKAIRRRLRGE